MGLDMYLERRHYVRRWDHIEPAKQFTVTVTRGGEPYLPIEFARVSYVTEHVAYWRKANAIHAWFVTKVQGGNDDCGDYRVPTEALAALLATVNEVLADPTKAEELLPTQSGFFFGGTDYDEDYFDDLKLTKEMLEPLVGDGVDADYYYHSSW